MLLKIPQSIWKLTLTNSKFYCGVIGNPIAHSLSPEIHGGFAKQFGINLQYDRILAEEEQFADIVKRFFAEGGTGLNVTVPFKVKAYELCDSVSEYAEKAGAVNTLLIKNGQLHGENTDGLGLVQALLNDHQIELKEQKILILGAGGASRGILLPLLNAGVKSILIANRNLNNALALLESHSDNRLSVCSLNEIPHEFFDLIINATSLGLDGQKEALFLSSHIRAGACYDLIYGKETPFLIWAKENHCPKIHDGYSMLINQARISFRHWFGV